MNPEPPVTSVLANVLFSQCLRRQIPRLETITDFHFHIEIQQRPKLKGSQHIVDEFKDKSNDLWIRSPCQPDSLTVLHWTFGRDLCILFNGTLGAFVTVCASGAPPDALEQGAKLKFKVNQCLRKQQRVTS